MLATRIVKSTSSPAFASGLDGTISAWNESAEVLMGVQANKVIGRRCCEVMAGRDVFGNDFCGEACCCRKMASEGRTVSHFKLVVGDPLSRTMELRVSILTVEGPGGPELVHLLESDAGGDADEIPRPCLDEPNASPNPCEGLLTKRETLVLRLLVFGFGTREIADQLQISTTTVRNHISRCLSKLNAHTRLQAVVIAHRLGLV